MNCPFAGWVGFSIICSAPVLQVLHFLHLLSLVALGNQSYHSCVICKIHDVIALYLAKHSYISSAYSRGLRTHPWGGAHVESNRGE